MRLLSAEVKGYGRLVDVKVNLDSKVIAIVGPNEAGKTTLLRALAYINSDASLRTVERSRATEVHGDTVIVRANFALDDEDRLAVADLDLEELPKTITVGRKADMAPVQIGVDPLPRKAIAVLERAAPVIRSVLASDRLDDIVSEAKEVDIETREGLRVTYRADLLLMADDIDTLIADGDADVELSVAGARAHNLFNSTVNEGEGIELRECLMAVEAWLNREEPAQEVRNRLWSRTPDFLIFDDDHRILQSVYTMDDALVANMPAALANLFSLAELDTNALRQYMSTGDIARRETAVTQANSVLARVFAESWKQSNLKVQLNVDGQEIRVLIWEDGDNVTVFDERSAGLRMFIALTAFLRVYGRVEPILLIDEAESHLHIDAQADLVNMFMTQEQAVKVIYTTHSPACLPPDLGTGIRAVVPRDDNFQISDIRNGFWQSGAGYSPLMLAMGAAAAAFTPARCVVLAEGATEMILLPTLIRAATGLSSLPYQIAPGLSEVPKDFYPTLDLEGAKVAYILDHDAGGKALEKSLVKAGVGKELIVSIGVSGIENLLEAEVYCEAIQSLLRERPNIASMPGLPELGVPAGESWTNVFKRWFVANSIEGPSKVAVASWLVQNSKAAPSQRGSELLRDVHVALLSAMRLSADS